MKIFELHKKRALIFVLLFVFLQTSGCASLQKDLSDFWNKLKAGHSDSQVGSRNEAAKKYGYTEKTDELFTELPNFSSTLVRPGDTVRYELQYAILSPKKEKVFTMSEVVVLVGSGETIILAQRQTEKAQGLHILKLQLDIPKDIDPGKYKIITTLSSGGLKKTVLGEFVVTR